MASFLFGESESLAGVFGAARGIKEHPLHLFLLLQKRED
jgi:hypothetical protein